MVTKHLTAFFYCDPINRLKFNKNHHNSATIPAETAWRAGGADDRKQNEARPLRVSDTSYRRAGSAKSGYMCSAQETPHARGNRCRIAHEPHVYMDFLRGTRGTPAPHVLLFNNEVSYLLTAPSRLSVCGFLAVMHS